MAFRYMTAKKKFSVSLRKKHFHGVGVIYTGSLSMLGLRGRYHLIETFLSLYKGAFFQADPSGA